MTATTTDDAAAATSGELVRYERTGDHAVVTLNRPDKRNAMNRPAQQRLREVLDRAAADGVRALVITGAGNRAFCAGADLKDDSPQPVLTAAAANTWLSTQQHIARHPAVIIAAVNGFALGGGLTLVNNADLAIAADTATFGAPEINYGIYPALAGPSTVQRIAPKHVAAMVLTGERIDAATAERYGLVNEVVPAAELMERAVALAARVATFDPVALDFSKQALRAETSMSWDDAMDHGMRSTSVIAATRTANRR